MTSITASKPFRFFVGLHKREFTIHSALIAHQSPALDKLVSGEFAEAQKYEATWESVDEQTFIRFVEYAYTGDYNEEEPKTLPESAVLDEPIATTADNSLKEDSPDEGTFQLTRKKKKSKRSNIWGEDIAATDPEPTKKERLWNEFKNTSYLDPNADSRAREYKRSRKNKGAHEDHTEIFLSHARLYVFADCYGISGLIGLSLHKLQQALIVFQLHPERVGDVVALLRYCYEDAVPDLLRSLVVQYTTCNIEVLWKSADFQHLLASHAELSVVLVGSMLDRLE